MQLSRRQFLKLFFSATLCTGLLGLSAKNTTDKINLKVVNINNPKAPKEFNDYNIIFIADIHYGPTLSDNSIEKIIDIINEEKPDLILLGGDFIHIPHSYLSKLFLNKRNKRFKTDKIKARKVYTGILDHLNKLKAKDGIYAVLGNHDRWLGRGEIINYFKKSKINLLINEEIEIKRLNKTLTVYGVDDHWTGTPKVKNQSRSSDFKILMSHNPDFIPECYDKFNLALCGHTHAGQIKIPFLPPFYNIRQKDLFIGLNYYKKLPVYTTAGIGVVEIPYRINCPGEITKIKLKSV